MRPLIEHPTLRTPPSDLVARLREIDPTAELVYVGAGHWALGSVQPNSDREQRARQTLGFYLHLPAEFHSPGPVIYARMRMQGFRHIALYSEDDLTNGRLLLDFRERDWNYRNRAEAAYRERIAAADREEPGNVEKRIETMLDYLYSEGPSIYRHTFQGRRSVGPSLN